MESLRDVSSHRIKATPAIGAVRQEKDIAVGAAVVGGVVGNEASKRGY